MTTKRQRRDPYTRTVVRLPERDLAESILYLAAPLLEPLGPVPPEEEGRRQIALAISLWNAHVTASKLWGAPKSKPLAELRKAMSGAPAAPGSAATFMLLSERWREEFAFDPRLVGAWSYEAAGDGGFLLVCETTLPDGVVAEVPPPAEKRIALGGSFLDEVRIRQGANAYRLFPVEHHQGVVGADGAATIRAKMPAVVQLFAEGRLAPIGGPPVDVMVGGRKLGPMVLAEVHCAGDFGRDDVAVLVFRPANASASP